MVSTHRVIPDVKLNMLHVKLVFVCMYGVYLFFFPYTEVVKTVVMKGKAPVDSECKAKLGKVQMLFTTP